MKTESKMATTTVLVEEEALKQLREIAQANRRSLGFLIRESITAWLAGRREARNA